MCSRVRQPPESRSRSSCARSRSCSRIAASGQRPGRDHRPFSGPCSRLIPRPRHRLFPVSPFRRGLRRRGTRRHVRASPSTAPDGWLVQRCRSGRSDAPPRAPSVSSRAVNPKEPRPMQARASRWRSVLATEGSRCKALWRAAALVLVGTLVLLAGARALAVGSVVAWGSEVPQLCDSGRYRCGGLLG